MQGSVSGLLEETQALARRLDGLDERLWARTSGLGILEQFYRDAGLHQKPRFSPSRYGLRNFGGPRNSTVFFQNMNHFYNFLYIIITVLVLSIYAGSLLDLLLS